ncbi:MAG TPA: hypothetical protein VFB58_11040 [Chloroflexota bacterium]|nr:hypothetical protein [Chloroflexota bacterium]
MHSSWWLRTLLLTVSLLVPALCVPAFRPVVAAPFQTTRCSAVTLTVRPGLHPPQARGPSIQPAPDSPRGPFTVSLPLYPGAVSLASDVAYPYADYPEDPYLQTASAEYHTDDTVGAVKRRIKGAFLGCGWHESGYWSTNASPFTSGIDVTADANPQLTVEVSFGADPAGGSDLGYGVVDVILPPRPAASYLHGPFVVLHIAFGQTRVTPRGYVTHVRHVTVLDRSTIRRLVAAIDSLRDYRDYTAAPLACHPGGGGPSTGPFWLAFIRPNGSVVHAYDGGAGSGQCAFGLAVNGVRWLQDTGIVWNQLLRLAGGRG